MAKYISEMLEFAYDASLHINHPSMSTAEITRRLDRRPIRVHSAGDRRRRPDGVLLEGEYKDNYWYSKLPTADGQDIVDFLADLTLTFRSQRDFLRQLSDTGGEVCCFIGVFTPRCCAHQFSRELLGELADMGMDLRLDIYGSDLPQKGLTLESDDLSPLAKDTHPTD